MRIVILISVCIACIFANGCHRGPTKKELPPPKVTVTKAESKTIPLVVQGIGHITPFNSAELRAQIEGWLLDYHFEEGQEVAEGDLLFTIDPRLYEASFNEALAKLAMDEAKLAYAREKVVAYSSLAQDNFVSALDYFQYETDLSSYEAEIKLDQANLETAEINLGYCYIRAPFSGITGKRLIDKGNLITNGGDPLLVLNQIDPIYIDFSVPEKNIIRLLLNQHQRDLEVEVQFPEYPNHTFRAKLVLIDNEIQKSTGMIPLRAQMANPERLFWPGQFVNAKVILTYIKDAIVVPDVAINYSRDHRFLLVLNDKDEAEKRIVEVGEVLDNEVEIIKGIKAGDRIITSGQIKVLPGKKVEIVHDLHQGG